MMMSAGSASAARSPVPTPTRSVTSFARPKCAVAEQLVDRGVSDEARVDHHRVVRLVPPERGLAVDDERAHGRAEALGREQHGFAERRIGNVGDAVERVADDVELELRLGLGGDVLPPAAAATLAGVDARRDDPRRARLRAPRRTRPAEHVRPVGGHLDADPLAGQGAVDQRDPAVVGARERITAGNHARRRQLHREV